MRYHISPVRHAVELVLDVFALGPRRSRFSPARNPESRVRFAQYVSRIQPALDPSTSRRATRLLGNGGAVQRGGVRHAPISDNPIPQRRPLFQLFTLPGGIAARRRASAQMTAPSLRTLLDALRAR